MIENESSVFTFDKLTEEDVKFQYITPAIEDAGWTKEKFRFEYSFTDGKMQVDKGKCFRGKTRKADYILLYKPNLPIAVVEAKDMSHGFSDGIQQALTYCEILNIPFAFSSNGKSFMEHDRLLLETKGVVILHIVQIFSPLRASPQRTSRIHIHHHRSFFEAAQRIFNDGRLPAPVARTTGSRKEPGFPDIIRNIRRGVENYLVENAQFSGLAANPLQRIGHRLVCVRYEDCFHLTP